MTPAKQVDFIERVYKSKLGLKGLEIVVECDRNCRGNMKDRVEFAKIGEEIMTEINGDLIKEKFGVDEGLQMKEILHQERIKLIKTKI